MLLIEQEYILEVKQATCIERVRTLVADAVTLELATLPTYLTGIFSIKPDGNQLARALIQSVAHGEMLHMTLASNLLLGIGGTPKIVDYGTSLKFPTKLPMGVIPDLIVSLNAITKEQIYDVFMAIECPDTTAVLPGETRLHWVIAKRNEAREKGKSYGSIADFYDAILDRLAKLPDAFENPQAEKQIDIGQWFPPAVPDNPSGKVSDVVSAKQVVEAILREGEGAKIETDPVNPYGGLNGSLAHYFKFAEIFYGRKLVEDKSSPSGWSYTGELVDLTEAGGIYAFRPNTALSDYTPGTAAFNDATEFYNTYIRLLHSLDKSFNGEPEAMNSALGIMYELKLIASKVVQHRFDPDDPNSYVCTPPFMSVH